MSRHADGKWIDSPDPPKQDEVFHKLGTVKGFNILNFSDGAAVSSQRSVISKVMFQVPTCNF